MKFYERGLFWFFVLFIAGGSLGYPVYGFWTGVVAGIIIRLVWKKTPKGIAVQLQKDENQAFAAKMLEKHQQALEIAGTMQNVLHEIKTIETFSDIDKWDAKAAEFIQRIEQLSREIQASINECELVLSSEGKTKAEKSNLAAVCGKLKTTLERLDKTNESLELAIDFTPNTPQEAKELVKSLKEMKKELTLEKKEIALEMKSISVAARQKSSTIGTSFHQTKFTRQMDRSSRIRLRLQKEAALSPHENQKMLIERQILDIDKNILWIEKLR